AIEARLGERQRFFEKRQRAFRIAVHHHRETAQVVELRRRRAGRLHAAELFERRGRLSAQQRRDHRALHAERIVGGEQGTGNQERKQERFQAAPLTWSSIWMSPRFTACTNASTTFGSKRVPA